MGIRPEYVFVAILIVIGIISYTHINKRKNLKKLKSEIIEAWGKEPQEKYNSEQMKSISSYYNNVIDSKENKFLVDDITWNDLDMDKVFMRVNNAQTTVGEEYLYFLLRNPVTDASSLTERNRLISFFRNNPEERLKLQFTLAAKLNKRKFVNISDYFYSTEQRVPVKGRLYKALLGLLLLSPFLIIVNSALGILAILTCLVVNLTVYTRAKNEIQSHLESLSYIVNMIGCARKITSLGMKEIEQYDAILDTHCKNIKGVSVKSFYSLFYKTEDPFLEYIKVVFLGELIAFESLLKIVYRHRTDLIKIYETIGLLDSMLSAASYRDSLAYHTVPDLYDAAKNPVRFRIVFKDVYHPLIKDPVSNSGKFTGPVLITGSNASGKSTFLKTIAINAIFAQTICTCLSREYSSCYFYISTSMALKDNLLGNESYYIAEIKSLKRIFDNLNENVPYLCLIDEVLRGTNTVERIAASSEVLFHLGGSNCICIAATHDIELTSILKNYFKNYHFQESFSDNEITFDYKLYPGKSNTRNAIKLLKLMGYEDAIVRSAEERALWFVDGGTWREIAGKQ